MSRTKQALIKAVRAVDNRPPASAEELIEFWLDGAPVHQSWHMHQDVLVLLVGLLQERLRSS